MVTNAEIEDLKKDKTRLERKVERLTFELEESRKKLEENSNNIHHQLVGNQSNNNHAMEQHHAEEMEVKNFFFFQLEFFFFPQKIKSELEIAKKEAEENQIKYKKYRKEKSELQKLVDSETSALKLENQG